MTDDTTSKGIETITVEGEVFEVRDVLVAPYDYVLQKIVGTKQHYLISCHNHSSALYTKHAIITEEQTNAFLAQPSRTKAYILTAQNEVKLSSIEKVSG